MKTYNENLLETMLSDMNEVSEFSKPTAFWRGQTNSIVDEIHSSGIASFRSMESALRMFVPTYGYPNYYREKSIYQDVLLGLSKINCNTKNLNIRFEHFLSGRLAAFADYRNYLSSVLNCSPFTDKFSESTVGTPVEQFDFERKLYSRSSLNYLLGINYFKKICRPKDIRTVVEIGGGFGSLGEILLCDSRNKIFYIDVDIPPIAYVATYYLQCIFGEKKIGDYFDLRDNDTLDIDKLRKRFSAVVLCPWQLPNLVGNIDLFVNYISFQEMEPDVVKNYLAHVHRLKARFILLRNLKEGKQVAKNDTEIGVKQPILGRDYDRFLPDYNLIDTNTVPYGYKTEDGYHSELRLYCRKNI